ncbi:hypothetical protein BT69DRAFT_179203 [Atractiella rhizophila]|nr:hypothetical protein BT69DRAFT_179203 [Atractiella rhizophila]
MSQVLGASREHPFSLSTELDSPERLKELRSELDSGKATLGNNVTMFVVAANSTTGYNASPVYFSPTDASKHDRKLLKMMALSRMTLLSVNDWLKDYRHHVGELAADGDPTVRLEFGLLTHRTTLLKALPHIEPIIGPLRFLDGIRSGENGVITLLDWTHEDKRDRKWTGRPDGTLIGNHLLRPSVILHALWDVFIVPARLRTIFIIGCFLTTKRT